MTNHIHKKPGTKDIYGELKPITDAAQAGELQPWGPAVVELLSKYGVNVERLKDAKVQVTLSFPSSTKNKSMAVGFRYIKRDGSFAEDLFLFEENVGLTCFYRGTQEKHLPEYDGTHHAKVELSEFLPDLQKEMQKIKEGLLAVSKQRITPPGVEIVSDAEHKRKMAEIQRDFEAETRSAMSRFGGSSAANLIAGAYQKSASAKRAEQMGKKSASDRMFQLELMDLNDSFDEIKEEKTSEMKRRGIQGSGIEQQELEKIESKREREIEKLKLKYGIEREGPNYFWT